MDTNPLELNPKTNPQAQAIWRRKRSRKFAKQKGWQDWRYETTKGHQNWSGLQMGRAVLYAFTDALGHLPGEVLTMIYLYVMPPWLDRYFSQTDPQNITPWYGRVRRGIVVGVVASTQAMRRLRQRPQLLTMGQKRGCLKTSGVARYSRGGL